MKNKELAALLRTLRKAGVTEYEDGQGLRVVLGPVPGGEGKPLSATETERRLNEWWAKQYRDKPVRPGPGLITLDALRSDEAVLSRNDGDESTGDADEEALYYSAE